jgi:hypothetical protein
MDFEHVIDNPDSVLSIPSPDCPHLADPDADCTCFVMINPSPNPAYDRHIPIATTVTMQPCGCAIRVPLGRKGKFTGELAGWSMYQRDVPEPGSLGELMADWAAMAEDADS